MKSTLENSNKKAGEWLWANFAFAFFVFVLSWYFLPLDDYDRSRHIERYEWISDNPIAFWEYFISGEQKDFLFYFLMYLGDFLGLSAGLFISLVNAITAYVLIWVFSRFLYGKNDKLLWFFFVLGFSYISLLSGVRFYFGFSLFSLFVYFFWKNKFFFAVFFLFLAAISHFSFLIFFIAFGFRAFPKFVLPLFCVGIFVAVASLAGVFDVDSMVANLNFLSSSDSLGEASKAYAEARGSAHRNLSFYIVNFWVFIPICFYALKSKGSDNLSVLLVALVFVMLFYVNNYPVFGRYFLPLLFLYWCCVAVQKRSPLRGRYVFMLGMAGLVRFLVEFHDHFDVYMKSYFS